MLKNKFQKLLCFSIIKNNFLFYLFVLNLGKQKNWKILNSFEDDHTKKRFQTIKSLLNFEERFIGEIYLFLLFDLNDSSKEYVKDEMLLLYHENYVNKALI